jgi:hypothetical protein
LAVPHSDGGGLDGADDVDVAGADTQVARECFADGGLVGIGLVTQQFQGSDEDPGRAVAALQAVVLPERLLEGMET